MLTGVVEQVNRSVRTVVLHHPNTLNCQLFRRVGTITPAPPAPDVVGSLDEEDSPEVDYAWIGNGYALQAEQFAPSLMMARQDANNSAGTEFRMLIEPEQETGQPQWFDVRVHDVVYLLLGSDPAGARLAFEVVGHEAVVNVPPYATRYIVNRRDDLHVPAGG
jgi:hypothetical protein